MLSPKNFHDVPLASEEHGPFDAHQVILSSARMSTRVNSQFVAASMTEFFSVWSLGGEASLNLTTRNGSINMSFNISLGHPSAPFPLPSVPPPPQKPRHRGPAEKERGRQRAARHQAAKAAAPPAPPVPVTDSVVNTPNPNPVTVSVTSPSATAVTTTDSVDYTVFNCDICDYATSTKRGVLTHKGHKHKEELRKEDENESLEISIVIEEREEDNNHLPLANSTFDGETELVGNDPLRLELQENGLAKIVISPDSPPPTLVLHPKLGIGKKPRLTKVQEKKCVEYTFEKGTFAIEIFP